MKVKAIDVEQAVRSYMGADYKDYRKEDLADTALHALRTKEQRDVLVSQEGNRWVCSILMDDSGQEILTENKDRTKAVLSTVTQWLLAEGRATMTEMDIDFGE